ncbi:hypothetical protein ABEY41_12365 [Peribacillus butanolivorans]|uniref:hypothetical protein n=1 Tax=Peribacillus butanolivorans TaxID=421767 RepID=UPI003D2A9841
MLQRRELRLLGLKKISFYKIIKEYESDDDTEIMDAILYSWCWTDEKTRGKHTGRFTTFLMQNKE